jgi:hypothetical protein
LALATLAVVTALSAIIPLATFPAPIVVAFPTLVTSPVKFAFVVTVIAEVAVAALPVILPAMGLVTVKFAKIPTLVKLEPVTVDFNVVPVNVPVAAGTVISTLPSNATPLIFFADANLVAVPALN